MDSTLERGFLFSQHSLIGLHVHCAAADDVE